MRRRKSLQYAVDFPVQLTDVGPHVRSEFADIRFAACQAVLNGSQATAESPSRAADSQDDRSPDRDHGDDDGGGIRGGSPRQVTTRRIRGLPIRRWRTWLGRFANRPPTACCLFLPSCLHIRQCGGCRERLIGTRVVSIGVPGRSDPVRCNFTFLIACPLLQ